jgi:hypothetical protein
VRTWLSLAVVVLSSAGGLFGQASMIPNYSSYTTKTAGTDGTAHVTQTITGYTQCSPICPNGLHQPHIAYKVTNVNTGVIEQNNTVSLGSFAPGANLNVSWTVNISPTDPCLALGDQCRIDFTGTVFCTVIGANLFNSVAGGLVRLSNTTWGPPPIKVGSDGCVYNVLACLPEHQHAKPLHHQWPLLWGAPTT